MNNKPVLYLLPGLLCDETVWEQQQLALAPYAQIVIPVFRGFSSFRDMALWVLKSAPPRFSVVGHSMGGRVALELMHLAPERIDKFGMLSVGVHALASGEVEERQQLVALAQERGMAALADIWIPPMVHPSRHKDVLLIAKIRSMVLRFAVDDYRAQITAALTRTDQSLYLKAIKHKSLLMCGADDRWSPLQQHQAIQSQLAAAELHVIANAGHMVTLEQADAVNQILLEWIVR